MLNVFTVVRRAHINKITGNEYQSSLANRIPIVQIFTYLLFLVHQYKTLPILHVKLDKNIKHFTFMKRFVC